NDLVRVDLVAVLVNSNDPVSRAELQVVEEAAQARSQKLLVLHANSESEIEDAFAQLVRERAGALLVGAGAYFAARRDQLVQLAAGRVSPTINQQRKLFECGGLISYGINFSDQYGQLGIYTGRILKGANPADLPVQQPTNFELLINLKAARELGLAVPPALL